MTTGGSEAGLDPRTRLLGDVAAALGSAMSLHDALQSLVSTLAPAYCDACEVVMPDADDVLRRVAAGPAAASVRQGSSIPDVEDHPVRRVFETGRDLLIDIDVEPEAFGPPDQADTATALGARSAVLASLTGRTGPLGVLALAVGPSDRRFGAYDLAFVPIVARLTALAIENLEAVEQQLVVTNRLRRVGRVAAALNASEGVVQIGAALVDVARAALGATTGLLYLVDGDDLVLAAAHGYEDDRLGGWPRSPLSTTAPAADAWRSGRPVVCEDYLQIVSRYPYVKDVEAFDEHAIVAVPVKLGGERLGAAFFSFNRARRFTEDDLSFLDLVADQVGAAIVRVRAGRSVADQAERLTASRARLTALAGVGVIGTLSGRDELILEANQTFLDLLGLAPIGPEGTSYVELTPTEYAESDAVQVAAMRRTGRLEAYEKEFLHRDGTPIPVLLGGATLSLEPFEWMLFAVDLRARRAAEVAAAKANEQLTEMLAEQRRIADVLQASLLPHSLPVIDGVELHAEHWPESDGVRVGGDFYDAFPITGDRWGLLIGDVCGKGVEAAAVTATARHTARAAAMHLRGPDAVLRWVHEAVREHPLDTYCTVAFAALSNDDPSAPVLEVCLGGHPPGLVCHPDHSIEVLGEAGTLLGLYPPTLTTTEHQLGSGDVVMFYTDGVTDAPGGGAMSEDELAQWLCARRDLKLPQIAGELRAELARRRPGGLRDDVATILLRVT
ncbi:MAG: SpoIIE family protein phosphatase [Ilumatobacteraceae bacterium]